MLIGMSGQQENSKGLRVESRTVLGVAAAWPACVEGGMAKGPCLDQPLGLQFCPSPVLVQLPTWVP